MRAQSNVKGCLTKYIYATNLCTHTIQQGTAQYFPKKISPRIMTRTNLYNCTKATSLNKQQVPFVNNKKSIGHQHEMLKQKHLYPI